MDFTIILEYIFSQFQDKNISLTVRKKRLFRALQTFRVLNISTYARWRMN